MGVEQKIEGLVERGEAADLLALLEALDDGGRHVVLPMAMHAALGDSVVLADLADGDLAQQGSVD